VSDETYYTVKPTSSFRKDLKRVNRQGRDIKLVQEVLSKLADNVPLEESYRDHGLGGKYKGCRECHIQPDWLLVYQIDNDALYLYLMRTGSHAELF